MAIWQTGFRLFVLTLILGMTGLAHAQYNSYQNDYGNTYPPSYGLPAGPSTMQYNGTASDASTFFQQHPIVRDAGVGAGLGAVVGGITAGSGSRTQGVLKGAAIGGVVGGGFGYFTNRNKPQPLQEPSYSNQYPPSTSYYNTPNGPVPNANPYYGNANYGWNTGMQPSMSPPRTFGSSSSNSDGAFFAP